MKHIMNWQDTHWTSNGKTLTITELIAFLGDEIVDIETSELTTRILTTQDRVEAANLDYPIIVLKNRGQYQCVLDGNHRLQKAINYNKSLKAKVLDLDDPETPELYRELFA